MISFALESPRFESHTDIPPLSLLSCFLCCFYNYCETTDIADECVCVYSGLTSLSTILQSYHDGVWLRQGAQCSLL